MKLRKLNFQKMIWFLNGIAVFIILVFIIVLFIERYHLEFGDDAHGGVIVGEEKEKAKQKRLELQTIRYSRPTSLWNTDYNLIIIDQTDYEIPRRIMELAKTANDFQYGVTINAIIFNEQKNDYRLILDKLCCVKTIDAPTWKYDSLQTVILYDLAFKDTNRDGLINYKDESDLYISELDGSNFRKITPDSIRVISHEFTGDRKRINLTCLVIPEDNTIPQEHWQQMSCYYDVDMKRLVIDKNINRLIEKARKILVS